MTPPPFALLKLSGGVILETRYELARMLAQQTGKNGHFTF
jgi:hypothetical protein